MNNVVFKLVGVSLISMALVSCSYIQGMQQSKSVAVVETATEEQAIELSGAPVAETAPLAGNIQSTMDSNDQNRLSRALDGGIGKEAHWVSARTGIAYTVVPTQKIRVGSNTLCRKYTITATRGGNTEHMYGSACIGSDGAWHTV